jgi:hypothetical protein
MTTFTIYHGTANPMIARGKYQAAMLAFAEKYRGWHSCGTDRADLRAMRALEKKGYLEINQFGQFRFTYPR